jgi:hypothetical protein
MLVVEDERIVSMDLQGRLRYPAKRPSIKQRVSVPI